MQLILVKDNEFEVVKDFYNQLIDMMGNSSYSPGWTDYMLYEYIL